MTGEFCSLNFMPPIWGSYFFLKGEFYLESAFGDLLEVL